MQRWVLNVNRVFSPPCVASHSARDLLYFYRGATVGELKALIKMDNINKHVMHTYDQSSISRLNFYV